MTDNQVLEVIQNLHSQNKDNLEEIKTGLQSVKDSIIKLPCKVHVERMKFYGIAIKCLYGGVILIVGWLFTTHVK